MKNKLRRGLALLMTMLMLVSGVPVDAISEDAVSNSLNLDEYIAPASIVDPDTD